jgi:hypothetical protein
MIDDLFRFGFWELGIEQGGATAFRKLFTAGAAS